jgi:hypothetical protein
MVSLRPSFLAITGVTAPSAKPRFQGEAFKPSNNEYDWLGPGAYFWEANPIRGLEFAGEPQRKSIREPFVVGAVIDLAPAST